MINNLLVRSDIIILRAVAVLLVIFYHYFPSVFELGYLGVDIFLVISGYLMVASYKSSKNGMHFILKRAYRLIPGLLSVALICFILIFLILRQDLVYGFAKEILTSVTGLSNYYYYSKLGYFDSGAENKLFLMSWTLSLEFQYYILLAVSFGLIFKQKAILLIAIFASFASNYITSEAASFYLIVPRLWEFLVGGLLFLSISSNSYKKSSIIVASVIVIIISYIIDFSFIESQSFIKQIIAVVFSVFVISKIVNLNLIFNFISKPLIWVGDSSYSLYLVHWPVLFFSRAFNLDISIFGIIISLSIVFTLGRLNFLYIEKKFTKLLRDKSLLMPLLIIVIFIFSAYTYNERSDLINKTVQNIKGNSCDKVLINNEPNELSSYCALYGQGEDKKIAVWGDSHAGRIARPMINGTAKNESIYMITHNACPPLEGIIYENIQSESGPCNDDKFGNKVVNYINSLDSDVVILVARWPMYFNGYDENIYHNYLIRSTLHKNISINSSITNTIKQLEAEKIIVIFPPIELTKQINVLQRFIPPDNYFKKLKTDYLESQQELKKLLIKNKKIKFFDIQEYFCNANECKYDDVPMYYYQDTNHISDDGADFIYKSLKLLMN